MLPFFHSLRGLETMTQVDWEFDKREVTFFGIFTFTLKTLSGITQIKRCNYHSSFSYIMIVMHVLYRASLASCDVKIQTKQKHPRRSFLLKTEALIIVTCHITFFFPKKT